VTEAIVTSDTHDCSAEAPDLAALDGPAKSGQPFVCSCGRLWVTVMQMTRGAAPNAVWLSFTETPAPPEVPT
jgi:hypothetical protein